MNLYSFNAARSLSHQQRGESGVEETFDGVFCNTICITKSLSLVDEIFVLIPRPDVLSKAALGTYSSILEVSIEDIEEIRKDKKAMNILFNGLDQDMFDNVINSQTAKEVWDTVQIICEGTEQVRENKMQLLIQQYEYFHFKEGESLNDTFNRFQKLLNGLKLYGRVYQVKDSNLKFLRSLPKEWKPMTVSLRNSQDYKNFTLE
ncbi:hypothetical protein AgCh_038421 [Apium graveolens]